MAAGRREDGTVFIAENEDPDDWMLLTARFRGHLDSGRRIEAEFDDLSAAEAIAWGRERCAVVLIRTGDSDYYSAGEYNPDPAECPRWPPEGLRLERRRPRGFEALDNSEDDPPVLWDVRASVDVGGDAKARRFHEVVRAESDAISVQAPAPGYPAASAAFLVEASTHGQAQVIADRIAERAFRALVDALLPHAIGALGYGIEVYPHRAGVPVRGPGTTY
jgi:hypothetical protein